MSREKLGSLKSGKTKESYGVHWDPETKLVFVEKFGWFSSTLINTQNKATSSGGAMRVAEAFLYNR